MLQTLPIYFSIGEVELCNCRGFFDTPRLVKKLVWYRNMFRNNFYNTDLVTETSTTGYLENIIQNETTRAMYVIQLKGELLGVYGIIELSGKRFLLDHALRFSSKGPKSLFSDISKKFICLVKGLDPEAVMLTAIKAGNKNAEKMHEYGNFVKMEPREIEGLNYGQEIELKKFVGFK